MVLLTILHQYTGAANMKNLREIGLFVLPVCVYWWNWQFSTNIGATVALYTLVEQCQLHQYVGGNTVYAQKFEKMLVF
jgi:hypothetical protein